MSKIAKAPPVISLIDRCSRSLAALQKRLLVERDPVRLAQLREDITVKMHRLDHLRAEADR